MKIRGTTAQFGAKVLSLAVILGCLTACTEDSGENEMMSVSTLRWGVELESDSPGISLDFSPISIPDSTRIVLLGEQTHGDGTTFLVKTEVIRYLYGRYGFDVLVFESGLFDCAEANEMLTRNESAQRAFEQCAFAVWAGSEQMQPLIEFIDTNRSTLSLAGMDFQFSGAGTWKERIRRIRDHARSVGVSPDSEKYRDVFNTLADSSFMRQPPDSLERRLITTRLRNLASAMAAVQDSSIQHQMMVKTLNQLPSLAEFYWLVADNEMTAQKASVRDSLMAENLRWLAHEVFPDRKIIVWGANSHVSHNRDLLEHGDKMIPMGTWLQNGSSHEPYTILFTSYSGMYGLLDGSVHPMPRASNRGFEHYAHENGFRFGWFDFSRLEAESPYRGDFKARFFGYLDKAATWCDMADAFIYIDTMKPNTRNE